MKLDEILKANGLEEDVVDKILSEMKTNKIYTAGEENLDIRYGKLKTDKETLANQLAEANKLIEGFKTSEKGNEELQGKITTYEGQVAELERQLAETKLNAALKVSLLSEKALDVDYLTFKLKEKGNLELDENGKIKGWDDKIAALKTQLPTQFEGLGNKRFVQENKLDNPDNKEKGYTKSDILKMSYGERNKFYEENKEEYEQIMNS